MMYHLLIGSLGFKFKQIDPIIARAIRGNVYTAKLRPAEKVRCNNIITFLSAYLSQNQTQTKSQLCTIISKYCSPCSIFSRFPFSCPQLSWLENPKRNPSSKYQSHEDFKNSQKSCSCHVNFKLEFQLGSTSF